MRTIFMPDKHIARVDLYPAGPRLMVRWMAGITPVAAGYRLLDGDARHLRVRTPEGALVVYRAKPPLRA